MLHMPFQADERRLAQRLIKQHLGQVMAVGQLLVVQWEGVDIVARVTSANTLDAAAQEVRREQCTGPQDPECPCSSHFHSGLATFVSSH